MQLKTLKTTFISYFIKTHNIPNSTSSNKRSGQQKPISHNKLKQKPDLETINHGFCLTQIIASPWILTTDVAINIMKND